MSWTDLPPETRQLVEATPGWCPSDQLAALFELAGDVAGLAGDIVEIGSWCGRSAAALALAAAHQAGGVVYCADLFPERTDWSENADGTYSFTVEVDGCTYHGCTVQTVWPEAYAEIDRLYVEIGSPRQAFDRLMETLSLDSVVRVVRGDSRRLTALLPAASACRLAYIDAEHSYEAVREDLLNIEPRLVDGALICFDDAFSGYPGVDRAIEELVLARPGYGGCRQLSRKLFVARRHAHVSRPVAAAR